MAFLTWRTYRRAERQRALAALAAVTLVMAVFATATVAFLWPQSPSPKTGPITLGAVDDFPLREPIYFGANHFWLVRLADEEFIALSAKDPHLGCTVPWRPTFSFEGQKGWFRNPCHGETYDLAGNRVFGPSPRGLDRYPVEIVDGEVRIFVEETDLILGPTLKPAEPVRP